jgi:hypothetical protein
VHRTLRGEKRIITRLDDAGSTVHFGSVERSAQARVDVRGTGADQNARA